MALLPTVQIQGTEADSNIPTKWVYPNPYVSMNSNQYYQPRYPQNVFYTSGMNQGLGKTFISSEPEIYQSQTKYVQNTPNRYTSELRRQYGYNRQPQSQSNAIRKQFFLNPIRNTGVQNSFNNNRRTTTLRSAVKRNTKKSPIRMVFAK